MRNILWLASWYPGRTNLFNGDFIERQALAISRFTKLTVLFVAKDPSLKRNDVQVEKSVDGNLVVYRVYYAQSNYGGFIEKILSSVKYFRLQKKIYREIAADEGKPDIVHVHVAMKAGMLALWLKKKCNIPFMITEHWTGYYPESKPNIYKSNWIFRNCHRKVLEEAAFIFPVSMDLGKMIDQNFAHKPYKVIPNVVDTSLFHYQPIELKKFWFIHPSYMNYQKNPEGILRACKMVQERGHDFELLMVGNKDESLVEISRNYGLLANVTFMDAVPYGEVAKQMQASSALLLFSRFENLPCVVLEALCCGLPVISSRVGGIPEVIDDSNGILVESEDEESLAVAMISMINDGSKYNRLQISEAASALYNYESIGRQYSNIYLNYSSAQ